MALKVVGVRPVRGGADVRRTDRRETGEVRMCHVTKIHGKGRDLAV